MAALCSRHADKARKVADAAGVADVHTDPLELIGRDDIAAVGIVTPPGAHHDLSIAALKRVVKPSPFRALRPERTGHAEAGSVTCKATQSNGRAALHKVVCVMRLG